LSGYPQKLSASINSSDYRTNLDLFRFGLENGFLPKHTKEVLADWKSNDPNFEVVSLDLKPVRGFYIEYNSDRRVAYKIKNKDIDK
jgi:hypothetical protein